jgi:hypothetical protein
MPAVARSVVVGVDGSEGSSAALCRIWQSLHGWCRGGPTSP